MKKVLLTITLLVNTIAHAEEVAPATQTPVAAPKPAPIINCQYHIPAATKTLELDVITTWAEKAAIQSFDLDHSQLDAQLANLKYCYTEQGWKAFNDALKQSGNLTAIQSQKLTSISQLNGKTTITALKDNQWKVNLPLQVVYQNDKERLTQQLSIDLLIGRKGSGDLGIMQLIAAPKQTSA
jgi:hypothetical protein